MSFSPLLKSTKKKGMGKGIMKENKMNVLKKIAAIVLCIAICMPQWVVFAADEQFKVEQEEAVQDDKVVVGENPTNNLTDSDNQNNVDGDDGAESTDDALSSEEESQTPSPVTTKQMFTGITPLSVDASSFVIKDWYLYRANGLEPDKDKGSNPADYANGLSHGEGFSIKIEFDVHAAIGQFLEPGDVIEVPFLAGGFTSYSATSPEPLMAGVTWRLNPGRLIIEFNSDLATGLTGLSDCVITTAPNLRYNNSMGTADGVVSWTIGGKTHQYKTNATPKGASSGAVMSKGIVSTSNSAITWFINARNDVTTELFASKGATVSARKSFYLEDEIPASQGVTGLVVDQVLLGIPYLMSETDLRPASIAGNPLVRHNIKSQLNEIIQTAGESYEQFKARLGELDYGIYKTAGGDFKFVMNYGDLTSPTFPLKFTDIFGDIEAVCAANVNCTPEEAAILAEIFSDNNAINGSIFGMQIILTSTYPQAFVSTSKTNTAVGTYDIDGVQFSDSRTANAQVSPGSGVAKPASHSAKIAKADAVSGLALAGVEFKLETSTDGGTTWDTVPSHNSFLTGADGTVTRGPLATGLYRFAEVAGLEGYDDTQAVYTSSTGTANGTFTIQNPDDTEGVVVTATNTPLKYTVKYNTDGGTPTSISNKTGVEYWDDDLLPNSNPTKVGEVFAGWKVSDGGVVGTTVTSASVYKDLVADDAVSSIALTAQWTAKQYKVKYDTAGGAPATIADKDNVKWNDDELLPASEPTKTGAIFAGWEVSDGGVVGTSVIATTKYLDLVVDDTVMEITLQAKWTDKSYTVKYDTDGGTPATIVDKDNVKWNDDGLLPASEPTKIGAIFAGWEVSDGGVVGISADAASKYSDLASNDAIMEITLQAQWTDKSYTVKYDTDGGTPAIIADKNSVKWNDDGLLPTSEPTKTGFKFAGWKVSAGGLVETTVVDDSKYSDLASDDNTMEVMVKAQWEALPVPQSPEKTEEKSKQETSKQETPKPGQNSVVGKPQSKGTMGAKTGDNTPIMWYLTVLLATGGIVMVAMKKEKRKKNNK